MNAIRHIAAVPSDKEQRCLRCCEIIVRRGASSMGPAWPGAAVTQIGDKLFSSHVAALVDDCRAVDLCDKAMDGHP